ncbi:hypothetical protein [Succinimonas sp.]|uniref:hypothetical protein n=1 Tax=Succinimonas sp. TaxID=1936151 RepID=UPI00386F66EC
MNQKVIVAALEAREKSKSGQRAVINIRIAALEAGEKFLLSGNQLIESSSVNALRKIHGDSYVLRFGFQGTVNVKVGISRSGYSFAWIADKLLSGAGDAEIPLDLSAFETGIIEITFFAITDAAVYETFSLSEQIPEEFERSKVLYDFLFPSLDLCSEEPIYCTFSSGLSFFSHEDRTVHLYKESSVNFLTYFNSFSSMKWLKYTNVRNLSVYLELKGNVEVSLLYQHKKECTVIGRFFISAPERGVYVLPVALEDFRDGILGVAVKNVPGYCLVSQEESPESTLTLRRSEFDDRDRNDAPDTDAAEIYGGGWLTNDIETQKVNLGIVITTFKRDEAVKAAVLRLTRDISAHDIYRDCIDIAVIDNGKTLNPDDVKGALLIPNRNLGGTGGFTRGLIHFQETGRHTHCLFMDDDASCEAGSIFRALSFQRHAIDHRVSLSGAMLFENIKFMQWENGAWFDGGCHSVNRDFDMRDPVKVFENEQEADKRIYGAWWFFFFPLDVAKNYALPFFVRGDDIDFSYANDFKVVSLNGVSCWQQDFKTKENAMTAYLFLRSHVVHHLTVPTLKCSFKIIKKILLGHFWAYNNSYYYGTAACVNLAMQHIMKGPEFWEDNIIPTDVLKKIKELSACEKPVPYTDDELSDMELKQAETKFKTKVLPFFIRRKSLYGHLMPEIWIKKTEKDMLPKWMTPYKEFTYMRSQVTVLDELNRTVMILKRDPKAYFKNLFTFVILLVKLRLTLSSLQKKYMEALPRQRSREFWKEQFKEVKESK